MNKSEYKKNLGRQIIKFLNGEIDFQELQDGIGCDDMDVMCGDEQIKEVWHAIYQFDLEINTSRCEENVSLKNCLMRIALALVHDDPSLEKSIDDYFNT